MSISTQSSPALSLSGITKRYGSTAVLRDISCDFAKGTISSIVGENGAGKSTLAKIIAGIVSPNAGIVSLAGTSVVFSHPGEAIRCGIGLVHQELSVLDNLSVSENILLGHETTRKGLIDKRKNLARAQTALDKLGSSLDPRTSVRSLSIAQKQHVEIARALSFDAKIIIFDEPTSSLSERETEHLLTTIVRLKSQGVTILYVSHRLSEVQAISDRVVTLRDGVVSGDLPRSKLSKEAITQCMIGRTISDMYGYTPRRVGAPLLEARNWSPTSSHKPMSFELCRGEIVGVAGLVGSGRSEILQAIFGIQRANNTGLILDGKSFNPRSPGEALMLGVSLVSEDRKNEGICPNLSISQTVALTNSVVKPRVVRSFRDEYAEASKIIKQFSVRCSGYSQAINTLSGGNQQKVLLGRALGIKPRLLLLDEPTRGVDIGAKKTIYETIFKLASSGVSVLFVSSELEEVMGIADKAIVMHEGEIAGIVPRSDFSEQRLFSLAAHNEDIQTNERSIA